MQYKISDRAAIEFSRSFYEALADGLPVDAAAAEMRKAISIAVCNSVEWVTPMLHMHSPDGRIFDKILNESEFEGMRKTLNYGCAGKKGEMTQKKGRTLNENYVF
jgi:hypothetical protein